jgi:hypothetical protein
VVPLRARPAGDLILRGAPRPGIRDPHRSTTDPALIHHGPAVIN